MLESSLALLQSRVAEIELQVALLQHNNEVLSEIDKGVSDTMAVLFPLDDVTARITSKFGSRTAPTDKASTYHLGIDISTPVGTNVNAATNGVVKETGYNSTSGNYVIIDNGSGIETAYRHLKTILVKKGDVVKAGQPIALSGNTGVSTGPHLHFETKVNGEYVDPLSLILSTDTYPTSSDSGVNVSASAAGAVKSYWPLLIGGLLAFVLLAPKRES